MLSLATINRAGEGNGVICLVFGVSLDAIAPREYYLVQQ